ncbi:MAG: antibiotic biosynthesis monooxygenase [Defluviitaleaceae bacterium]|nr:antibiotic biosynthesis monooxygenase [Defluviitaleaceae bacterium]
MIIVHAFIEIKEGTTQDFKTAAAKCVAETNKEQGCLFYNLYQDGSDPLKFVIVEEWENKEALDLHFILPHFLQFREDIKDIAAKPAKIKIFEAQEL